MTDGLQDPPMRDALAREVAVPPDVTERMLAAISAEHEHQVQQRNESATSRRRPSRSGWLIGAAAAVGLLLAIGAGMRATLMNPQARQALPTIDAVAAESDAGAGMAGDIGVARRSSVPSGSTMPEPPQAKEDAKSTSTLTLTAANIVDQVRGLLSTASTQPQSQTSISAQCAAMVGRSDVPEITRPVDFEGKSGMLVVWWQPDSYSIWVLASHCVDANSVIYHSLLPSSGTE